MYMPIQLMKILRTMTKVRNNWVPYYLQTFLKMLGLPELKQNSIGQCIIQAARPRSV